MTEFEIKQLQDYLNQNLTLIDLLQKKEIQLMILVKFFWTMSLLV